MTAVAALVAAVALVFGGREGMFSVRVYGIVADGPAEPPAVVVPVEDVTPLAVATATVAWSIEGLICSYPWPCEQALAVAWCESRYDPAAYNPSGASGLFQIIPYWHSWRLGPGESLFDPAVNVRVAYELYAEQGWRPWVCQP